MSDSENKKAESNNESGESMEDDDDGDPGFEVEKILDHKYVRGKLMYLLKWVGYPESENSWEPEENLVGCPDIINAYEPERQHKDGGRTKRSGSASSSSKTLGSSAAAKKSTPSVKGKQAAAKRPSKESSPVSSVSSRSSAGAAAKKRRGAAASATTAGAATAVAATAASVHKKESAPQAKEPSSVDSSDSSKSGSEDEPLVKKTKKSTANAKKAATVPSAAKSAPSKKSTPAPPPAPKALPPAGKTQAHPAPPPVQRGASNETPPSGLNKGWQAERVLGAVPKPSGVQFLVKWKGITDPELIPSQIVRYKFPQVVIDFYEEHLTWHQQQHSAGMYPPDPQLPDDAVVNDQQPQGVGANLSAKNDHGQDIVELKENVAPAAATVSVSVGEGGAANSQSPPEDPPDVN